MKLVRTLTGLALGTAIALAVPVTALADHLPDLEVTTSGGKHIVEVLAVSTDEQFIPKGGEPTDEFPTDEADAIPGDGFTFTEDLFQDDELVGTDKGVCTLLENDEISCEVTVSFADGTMTVRFQGGDSEDESATSVYPISGGSGAYLNAAGTATVTELDEEGERSDITLAYTTDAPTQVAEVPAGGADTGGTVAAKELVAPKATKDGDETTIEVHAVATDADAVTSGGQPIVDEVAELQPGDVYRFEANLTQDEVLVGTEKGACTNIRDAKFQCELTYSFPRGTIGATGPFEFTDELPVTVTFDIGSGTGAYTGAGGTLRVVFNDDEEESTDDTLTFTTGGASQVELVPTGAANTGGGARASTTDTALLIAVGLAAVAGGAGVFGAARVAARRP